MRCIEVEIPPEREGQAFMLRITTWDERFGMRTGESLHYAVGRILRVPYFGPGRSTHEVVWLGDKS